LIPAKIVLQKNVSLAVLSSIVAANTLFRHAEYRDPFSLHVDRLKQRTNKHFSSFPLHKSPTLTAGHSLASLSSLTLNIKARIFPSHALSPILSLVLPSLPLSIAVANQRAVMVARIATGEIDDKVTGDGKKAAAARGAKNRFLTIFLVGL
jgi:hypothetical protein